MIQISQANNIHDLRTIAQRKLPKGLFEYVDRGTEDEVALRNNRSVFESLKLVPRVLVNVENRSLSTSVMGKAQKLPLIVAPTGSAGLLSYKGEVSLARAAADAGIPFTLSTSSITAMEELNTIPGGNHWFQLYVWKDRSMAFELMDRALAAGFSTLVVTVDTVVVPNREYNTRNGFEVPVRLSSRNFLDVVRHPGWMLSVLGKYVRSGGMPKFENYPLRMRTSLAAAPGVWRVPPRDEGLDWDALRALRRRWPGKLVLKGILCPEDASHAIDSGVDAIVVSNHGGRNFDSSMAPVEALPRIVDVSRGRIDIIVDGGFLRGSDVIKAIALGAKAVMLGKGLLYGIAAGGEGGAVRALDIYREEMDRTLAFMGCRSLSELNANSVQRSIQRYSSPPI